MSPARRRAGRVRRLWNTVRRALGLGTSDPPPPSPPPEEEPALVGAGPPRRPSPSAAAALELPEDPIDTDARGHDA